MTAELLLPPDTADQDDRPLGPALRRGWRCRCPNCGEGRIFVSYLKIRDTCDVCGEALHHQRADDGPAYLTILIVGHILAPLIVYVSTTAPNRWFWRRSSQSLRWRFPCICCRA